VLPGPVILLETLLLGVEGGVLPAKHHPIHPHRADLDADTAGGLILFTEFPAPVGTVDLLHGWGEVLILTGGQGMNRASSSTEEAPGAQVITNYGVTIQGGGGEDGGETNPGSILWS